MKVGIQIKRVRKSKGISQKDLAAKVGLSPVHFNGVENDRRDTTLKVLEKIAKAMDTHLSIAFIDKE